MNVMKTDPERFADEVMAMNRHQRRAFAKKNRIPIKIAGSNKPYVKPITRT